MPEFLPHHLPPGEPVSRYERPARTTFPPIVHVLAWMLALSLGVCWVQWVAKELSAAARTVGR